MTPGPKDPQKGDILVFTQPQPSSVHTSMGALACDPGTRSRRRSSWRLACMGAVQGWHRAARTRSQAACQHLKAGVTAARWAKHGHWYHGLQALIGDYICLELLLKSPFPAFSVPTCPGTNPYAFILGPRPPSPRPACSGGPAGQRFFQLSLCATVPVASLPLIGMLCVWSVFCHTPKYKPR